LRGADRYDSLRGDGLDFLILDEYASIAKEAWLEVLRPALADRQGKALFIGTPRGYDHFYDLFQMAQKQPEWAAFQFTTEEGGNVPATELEMATRDLDEKTYRQEFQASFENLTGGLVYYAFDRKRNVEPQFYRPGLPLFWSLDFNINPMCSVIGRRDGDRVYILDEFTLADCNTETACVRFFERIWAYSRLMRLREIHVYGDATGNGRNSAASRTDWQIVRDFCKRQPFDVSFQVPRANPPVKDRVNCLNAMLHNQAGYQRLYVDPKCKELIQDFERVHWKKDPAGNSLVMVDKSDPARTHVSDALGYMIAREFGMLPEYGERPEFIQ
jgi:Terminase large subunit, T4likevirus-type, N-terminal